jgi:hypothetical protein
VTRLEQALALARQGFLIFPLRPGTKAPFSKDDMGGRGWTEYMTSDEDVIRHWFLTIPNMNYAVTFGERGFILDPDESVSKHGVAALEELEAENFEEPVVGETFTVLSPRGGQHLYFTSPYPVGNSRGTLPASIDVRGRGGYVVGPGSATVEDTAHNTAEGDYTVVCDKAPMQAPAWLLDKLERAGLRDENAQREIYEYDLPHAIEQVRGLIRKQTEWPTEGQGGDQGTYEFIALARGWSVSPEKMLELLTEPYGDDDMSWNDRCLPPWDLSDLERKIENVYAYATSAPGVKGGLLDSLDDEGQQYVTSDTLDPDGEAQSITNDGKNPLEALYFPGGSLLARDERRETIIPDWLLAHGMTALLAKRGTGKTVAMLDMALRIANDIDWHDMPVAKDWACVYACGEDDLGLQEQMAAWIKVHGVIPNDDRFIVMAAAPNLLNPEEAEAWTRFILGKLKGRRAIFFVDTWQRATSRASQNDDDDIQNAVAHTEAMAKSFRGPAVVAVHPPKANDSTTMGSSVFENSTVAIWKMTKEPQYRLLEVTRIKGKGEGCYQRFKFNIINLGETDELGEERTGVVAESLGGSKAPDNAKLTAITNDSRFYYASLLLKMYWEAEEHEEKFSETRERQFSLKDTAIRLIAKAKSDPNNHYFKLLRQLGDTAFSQTTDTMRKHLSNMFVKNVDPQATDEDGMSVAFVQKGRDQRMVLIGGS